LIALMRELIPREQQDSVATSVIARSTSLTRSRVQYTPAARRLNV
jgi:hypothetical protein